MERLSKVGKPFFAVGRFVSQTVAELRKTVFPTRGELLGWSMACYVFVGLLMAAVTGVDYGLGRLTLWIFG